MSKLIYFLYKINSDIAFVIEQFITHNANLKCVIF